ncbi:MAG: hypothetical protein HC773_02530 [Scytonema sp. CRU_2_7]|nr:hypothetical protein [Scytonema sp. CRU_2_7]
MQKQIFLFVLPAVGNGFDVMHPLQNLFAQFHKNSITPLWKPAKTMSKFIAL